MERPWDIVIGQDDNVIFLCHISVYVRISANRITVFKQTKFI